MQKIKVELIKIDGGTQRRNLDTAVSDHYVELMKAGTVFPAIELVHDGKYFYVWDGFHRLSAAKMLDLDTIGANVQNGSKEDAVWLSYSANTTHGLPRKPGEVKQSIEEILANPKWSCKTDKEIAEHINCGLQTVRNTRADKNKPIQKVDNDTQSIISVKSNPELPKGKIVEDEEIPANNSNVQCIEDEIGNILPEPLAEYWLENRTLRKYINILNEIKRDFDGLMSVKDQKIRLINWNSFNADWQNLKSDINSLLFYALCPYCQHNGADKNCNACKGTNFVNKMAYDSAPSEWKNQEEEF